MLDTVLDSKALMVNKMGKILAFIELFFLMDIKTVCKQNRCQILLSAMKTNKAK